MKEVITTAIVDTLATLGLPAVPFVVDHPADFAHGDYACNVALVLAKQVGKAPRTVAEELQAVLTDQIEYVDRIEVAGPGFLNFHLSRDFFAAEIERVQTLGTSWGENKLEAGEEILFEYTSPNLFKPLHIGNLVGNIIGESLTRLFENAGATVRRLNYPSDIGLTVAKGVWGLRETNGDPTDITALGTAYRIGNDAYENDPDAKAAIEAVNRALYAGEDVELMALRAEGLATSQARLQELCQLLGTTFDAEIHESEVSESGKELTLANIGTVFTQSEGAVVYEGEKHGLHTRVFLNSQGLPTYEAKDLGNFARKNALYPNWTQAFVVTGSEQREYFKVLIAALREVFPDAEDKNIEHIATGFLTLTTGKMSSRKGNVLTGESLLEEMEEEARAKAEASRADDIDELTKMVAVAALKYQILRQAPGTNIVFDKERALSFEGDSGPYLQYTHARLVSVLQKAKAANVQVSYKVLPEDTYLIEKIITRYEEVVAEALIERAPHKVTTYLTELAGAFNTFYAHEKIADGSDPFAPYKLAVAQAVQSTLKNGLWILGIKAPEQM
jgi:arginyl-tRNA synthetase